MDIDAAITPPPPPPDQRGSKGKGKGNNNRSPTPRQDRGRDEHLRKNEKSPTPSRRHSPDGGRPRSPSRVPKAVCRFHLKGQCTKGKDCPYKHNPPCQFFRRGNCRKGDTCEWQHIKEAMTAKSRSPSPSQRPRSQSPKDKPRHDSSRGRSPHRKPRSPSRGKATVCLAIRQRRSHHKHVHFSSKAQEVLTFIVDPDSTKDEWIVTSTIKRRRISDPINPLTQPRRRMHDAIKRARMRARSLAREVAGRNPCEDGLATPHRRTRTLGDRQRLLF